MKPSESVKPCFFCGERLESTPVATWKNAGVYCKKCVIGLPINPEKYNTAYCWQELDRTKRQMEAYRQIAIRTYSMFDANRHDDKFPIINANEEQISIAIKEVDAESLREATENEQGRSD